MSSLIEEKVDRVPQSLEEAIQMKVALHYLRHSEDEELAVLCMQHNMAEPHFDRCLELEKRKKTSDRLPDVLIDGQCLGKPGYVFAKLPIVDKRAYLLGHLTHCCQSIGGDSEECVIDGVTRENNGFYVLLKRNPDIPADASPFLQGKINDLAFSIVGQGYVWLSMLNNLTIDSWENLHPEADDDVVVPLLLEFSRKTLEIDEDILRVTIGTGGKTPNELALSMQFVHEPELMAEGGQYADSKQQVLLAKNTEKIQLYEKELSSAIQAMYGLHDVSVHIYSIKHVKDWQQVFLNQETVVRYRQLLGEDTFQQLLSSVLVNPCLLRLAGYLHQVDLLTAEHCQLMQKHAKYALAITHTLGELSKIGHVLTANDFKQCVIKAPVLQKIANAIPLLHSLDPNFFSDSTLELLGEVAIKVISTEFDLLLHALKNVAKINLNLLCNESLELLALLELNIKATDPVAFDRYIVQLIHVLNLLNDVNPNLVTMDNFRLLTQSTAITWQISRRITALHRNNREKITDDYFKKLSAEIGTIPDCRASLRPSQLGLLAKRPAEDGGNALSQEGRDLKF